LQAQAEVGPSRTWRFAIGPARAVERWQAGSREELEVSESIGA